MVIATDTLITPEIFKTARYLGNELGAKHKDFDTAKVRWVLTYPEVYEVGASNLGHIILYNIINAQPRQMLFLVKRWNILIKSFMEIL